MHYPIAQKMELQKKSRRSIKVLNAPQVRGLDSITNVNALILAQQNQIDHWMTLGLSDNHGTPNQTPLKKSQPN
jgi:hypothetical protein